MNKLTPYERATFRGWAVDYAIRENTTINRYCGIDAVGQTDKIISDAQKIYDFIAAGSNEACEIIPLREIKK